MTQLSIFHISAFKPVGYDAYDAFVVIAENEAEARKYCVAIAADEGEETWRTGSNCIRIGTADSDQEPGVNLGSFNAG